MNKCQKCGASIPEEAHICLNCMTVSEIPSDEAVATRKAKRTSVLSKTRKRAVISLLLAIVILIGFFSIPVNDDIPLSSQNGASSDSESVQTTTDSNKTVFDLLIKNPIQNLVSDSQESSTLPYEESTVTGELTEIISSLINIETTSNSSDITVTKAPDNTTSNSEQPSTPSSSITSNNLSVKYEDWEYYIDKYDNLHISKYIGDDKNVIIPSKFGDIVVSIVDKEVFLNNNIIENAYFQDASVNNQYYSICSYMFKNCPKLKKVVFPKNCSLGIGQFAVNCTSLDTIEINNTQYFVDDGGLYCKNYQSVDLIYYCEGRKSDSFTFNNLCTKSSSNLFQYNKYIKKIYLNANMSEIEAKNTFSPGTLLPAQLEGVYINSTNYDLYSDNGVLYGRTDPTKQYECYAFPSNYQCTDYTVPDNASFYSFGFKNIKNVKTLRIHKNCGIGYTLSESSTYKNFPNLETVYIQKGNSELSKVQKECPCTVIVY